MCDEDSEFRYIKQEALNEHFYSCLRGHVVELKYLSTLENLIKLYEEADVVPDER